MMKEQSQGLLGEGLYITSLVTLTGSDVHEPQMPSSFANLFWKVSQELFAIPIQAGDTNHVLAL